MEKMEKNIKQWKLSLQENSNELFLKRRYQNFEVDVMLSLSKHYFYFKIQKIINFDKPVCRQRQAQFDNLLNFDTASFYMLKL